MSDWNIGLSEWSLHKQTISVIPVFLNSCYTSLNRKRNSKTIEMTQNKHVNFISIRLHSAPFFEPSFCPIRSTVSTKLLASSCQMSTRKFFPVFWPKLVSASRNWLSPTRHWRTSSWITGPASRLKLWSQRNSSRNFRKRYQTVSYKKLLCQFNIDNIFLFIDKINNC